ncbi:MAG: putative glycolipid-binding domain-containing protein [Methanomicrobiales archaeon]|nr:putative glycolipid-binding domain-containing protein [Methanomicrobiales archaeon]
MRSLVAHAGMHRARCPLGRGRAIDLDVDEPGFWYRKSGGILGAGSGFTPSTSTLPIRRLALASGEVAKIRVVWLRFPEYDVVVPERECTRLAADLYRFESGDFRAILETDEHGVVTRHGDLRREVRG